LRRNIEILNQIDWLTVLLFYCLVTLGWFNIYAVAYEEGLEQNLLSFALNSGRQLVFIGSTILVITIILVLDFKFYDRFTYLIYGLIIVLLLAVLLFAREINGARSWIQIGGLSLQPSEFAKFATALAMAKLMSQQGFKLNKFRNQVWIAVIVGLPMGLTVLQGDVGTALIFSAFILVLFREGMSPVLLLIIISFVVLFILSLLVDQTILLISIGVLSFIIILIGRKSFKRISLIVGGTLLILLSVKGIDYAFKELLKPHQQNRILVLLNPNIDPLGAGWNVTQSKIAIGSGGWRGKGFLNGTQTKFDFVPEQSTDFIFCTIGEEHGWIGSFVLITLFVTLLLRVIYIAERQKHKFTRIYGYSVASILFMHFAINIGMTIGLFPVIGIPLPFFSYGGSSLIAFTIFLFILLKLDAHRAQMLAH